ncbi:pilus assembly protein N-terminal domain-containing protein, partial [Bradyrhizobium sp. Lot11]
MSSSGKTIFFAGMIAVFGISGISAAADDDMLRVYMDHARVLKLDRPVSKVIVGN